MNIYFENKAPTLRPSNSTPIFSLNCRNGGSFFSKEYVGELNFDEDVEQAVNQLFPESRIQGVLVEFKEFKV